MPIAIPMKRGAGKARALIASPTKHVAVVMQITCGSWFSRHYHFNVSVLEVETNVPIAKVRESAEKASVVLTKIGGKKTKVLDVQVVDIANLNQEREIAAEFLSNVSNK